MNPPVVARKLVTVGHDKGRVRDLRAVSEAHVIEYARIVAETKTERGTRYTAATQRSYLMTVQRLFRYLERQGVIFQDPTLNLVLPSWKKLPRAVLNQAHARRLIANPDTLTPRGRRDRALLELLYGTAIRVGECERIDLKDVDLARGQLMIRSGKGRKDRVVPVVGRAAAALDVYLKDARPELVKDPREPALFITSWGTRVNTKRIQDLVRTNAKAAGIDIRVTPHTPRLRDSPPAGRRRRAPRPEAPRPFERADDGDLHPRGHEGPRPRDGESPPPRAGLEETAEGPPAVKIGPPCWPRSRARLTAVAAPSSSFN